VVGKNEKSDFSLLHHRRFLHFGEVFLVFLMAKSKISFALSVLGSWPFASKHILTG
jgi:hypothetical protein